MKIFISWSGERSKRIATYLKGWIKRVLQGTEPWISTKDTESGSIWFSEVNDQLANTYVGIICLTKYNKDKPWILFESGALIKGLTHTRLIPLLIDIEKKEIEPPLSLLQAVYPIEEDIHKLLADINKNLTKELQLSDADLKENFDLHWPKFLENLNTIVKETEESVPIKKRSLEDLIGEVLQTVRELELQVRGIKNMPALYGDNRQYKTSFNLPTTHKFNTMVIFGELHKIIPIDHINVMYDMDSTEQKVTQFHVFTPRQLGPGEINNICGRFGATEAGSCRENYIYDI